MEIKEAIVNFGNYDLGAVHATQGFDFQCHWSLSKLLDLYRSGNEFIMLIDHIDDALVYEVENGQKFVEFFQIKKKDKKWSIKDLTRKRESEKDSIISKMARNYFSFESCENQIKGIYFISNQNFTFNVNSISIVKCSHLSKADFEELSDCVKNHCHRTDTVKALSFFRFQETDLEPKNVEIFSRGKITSFLTEMPFPVSIDRIEPFYTTLIEEILRKIKSRPQRDDFDTLSEVKGISRSTFDNYLTNITNPKLNLDVKIDKATQTISSSNLPLIFRKHFNRFSTQYWLETQNKTNRQLAEIVIVVSDLIDNLNDSELNVSPYDIIQIVYDKFKLKPFPNSFFIDEQYLKVIIFIEVHGKF